MLCSAPMSEPIAPNETEPPAKSKFELVLGKAHLRMENVSERVQLAVVYGATACALGLIARSALPSGQNPTKNDKDDQADG